MGLLEIKNEFARKWELGRKELLAKMGDEAFKRVEYRQTDSGIFTLDIEPTNDCNLCCSMCCRTVVGYNQGKYQIGYMGMKLFRTIIDQAIALGTLSIRLAWYGEPLLHPHIAEMVAYAKERGIVDVGFNTNAVCLDKNNALKLIESGLDRLVFSVDSPYKEEYEKIRIGANFESVIENIMQFNVLRNQLGAYYLLTRATLVLMEENKKSIDDFVKLMESHVDIVATGFYHNFNSCPDEMDEGNGAKEFVCPYLWTGMVIGWDGNVYVCSIDGAREYCVGNVSKELLKDIWYGDRYAEIRTKHLLGKYKDVSICRKCNLIKYF